MNLYRLITINWCGDEFIYGYMYATNAEEAERHIKKITPSNWRCRVELADGHFEIVKECYQ